MGTILEISRQITREGEVICIRQSHKEERQSKSHKLAVVFFKCECMCHFSLFFHLSEKAQCSAVVACSADDTSKSMLLQKCLNIFNSAVKNTSIVYIFMSSMLLIAVDCCSLRVSFLHSASLRWDGVFRKGVQRSLLCTSVNVCDKTC